MAPRRVRPGTPAELTADWRVAALPRTVRREAKQGARRAEPTPAARLPTVFANLRLVVNVKKKSTGKGAARAGAVTVGASLMLLLSSPGAHALVRDDGDDPGPGLSVFETLSLFVAAPILLFALIAGLVIMGEKKPAAKKD